MKFVLYNFAYFFCNSMFFVKSFKGRLFACHGLAQFWSYLWNRMDLHVCS